MSRVDARAALFALFAMVLGTIRAGDAAAQISPGPLSTAHASLEGMTNCLKCHGLKEKSVDAQCLACHGEIARLREDGRGFHARDARGECAGCHLEHGGTDFDLVDWGAAEAKAFDHSRAGWVLEGKHAKAACESCHKAELRVSPVVKLRQGELAADSWLGLETACTSCHKDPHANRFGTSCTDCHTPADWHTIASKSFDHDKTRYPLRGKHRETACKDCHRDGYKELPLFAKCADCHQDPHRGQATLAGKTTGCESCHGVEGFAPSTYDVGRHAGAKYALEQRHTQVACAACHRPAGAKGAEAFRFRMTFAKCAGCHADPHGKQLAARTDKGSCEGCHDLKGFRPSTFSVAAHAKLAFPLEGAHEKATCESCHGPSRPGLQALPSTAVLGKAGVLFRFERSECVSCHHDPHGEALERTEKGCRACHDAWSFHPAAFDATQHEKTEFPLQGAHAAVPCSECHRALAGVRPKSTLAAVAGWPALTFSSGKACKDCHEDPHGGQFAGREDGGDCAGCHGADSFRPASRFDHDRDSTFPLAGGHAKAACAACHREGTLASGRKGAVYLSTPRQCEACHLPSSERGKP